MFFCRSSFLTPSVTLCQRILRAIIQISRQVGHKGAAAWISKDGASTVYERLVRSVSLYSQPSLSEQRPRRHDQNLTTTTVSTTTISSTTISTTTIGDGECASFQSLCCNGKCINTAYVDDGGGYGIQHLFFCFFLFFPPIIFSLPIVYLAYFG